MHIISASYRTDIPAFYGDWFMRRIRAGYVRYRNPYGPQVVTVSLKAQDVHAIVFWSKNFTPFMKHLDELDSRGYDYYFQYTITAQPRLLEERVPDSQITMDNFKLLSQRTSPDHVQWRYDPIVFSNRIPPAFHREAFARLAESLAGFTHRCYFSFLDLYVKVKNNLRKLLPDLRVYDPPQEDKRALALELAQVAAEYGITLYTCAEDFAAVGPIQRGSCVDVEILNRLFPEKQRAVKLSTNRGGCGCYDSRDIGTYDTCPYGCIYCYAGLNRSLAVKHYRQHDPNADALLPIGPGNRYPPTPGGAKPYMYRVKQHFALPRSQGSPWERLSQGSCLAATDLSEAEPWNQIKRIGF